MLMNLLLVELEDVAWGNGGIAEILLLMERENKNVFRYSGVFAVTVDWERISYQMCLL